MIRTNERTNTIINTNNAAMSTYTNRPLTKPMKCNEVIECKEFVTRTIEKVIQEQITEVVDIPVKEVWKKILKQVGGRRIFFLDYSIEGITINDGCKIPLKVNVIDKSNNIRILLNRKRICIENKDTNDILIEIPIIFVTDLMLTKISADNEKIDSYSLFVSVEYGNMIYNFHFLFNVTTTDYRIR